MTNSSKTKPFIDKDLQLRIPEFEASNSISDQKTKSIYIHYCNEAVLIHPELEAIEQELDSAMSEARQSRAAWQQMQSQLKATYQKHPVITPKT